jgi:defect-in-organelle-trafficking protein DotC
MSGPVNYSYSDERRSTSKPMSDLKASEELLNYSAGNGQASQNEENLIAKSVREAGRRLGATSGYADQADVLYSGIADYDRYLSEIFDFNELMLPNGIVPPVLAQTENTISYRTSDTGQPTKEIRAQVLKTVRDATFANTSGPHWRDYLRLTSPSQERPHPKLQPEINANRTAWQEGVREGYHRGIQQANQAFAHAINELSRDYSGMQLFRMLWMADQVEAPTIVEQSENVLGGGRGNKEMSIGVQRIVISEPAYFVNDTSEWNALISSALDRAGSQSSGLSDIVQTIDNTQHSMEPSLEPNLRNSVR